ncbi:MAG: DNA methyltransferase [Kiritimatiellia bacterium]
MAHKDRQQAVLDILQNLKNLDGLKKIFWEELNYERENKPISSRQWPSNVKQALAEDPVLFASGGEEGAFHVVYCRLEDPVLKRGLERPVVNQLLRDHPYVLFVFSNKPQTHWHFLNVKYEQDMKQRRLLRRITIGPDERLRTAAERLCLIDLSQIGGDLFGRSPMAIQESHDEAFDVEAVTKQFFIEYRSVFQLLQDDLARQTKDKGWAHDYALQFLNRCMFLYFIQRKRWLGQDKEFLRTYWETYQRAKAPADTFFAKWLKVLFFEAFNQKVTAHHRHLPDEIRKILAVAPYLNGGLFMQNDLDDQEHSFAVSDARFAQVFKFLERYNFTIAEDSPLDQEVAVDPEMIGKVYESLVNVSAEADERGDAGIFYTPRTEIDLMCRLTLVDQLSNHVGDKHRNLFYELVFAIEPDEKVNADAAVAKAGLWPAATEILRNITVVDPACGSGSFLVGMLYILDDLQNRAQAHGAAKESAFERRKRIIGRNLYGVDVMDWACHVAELRLWLALVVDAQFSQAELSVRKEPLLPHFTFKIRQGDSLVQEVGGVNLGRLHASRDIKPALKARITALKHEKLKFYQNAPDRKYRAADQIRQEELRLFRDILDARVDAIEAEIKSNRQRLEGKTANLFGEQVAADAKLDSAKQRTALEAKTEELTGALYKARTARAALKTVQNVPFVWDIAFVEVFEDEKDGFDIVIGNPPYVAMENISDPLLSEEDVSKESKTQYKDKLCRAVYQAFPTFFGYKAAEARATRPLSGKSDLYVFFHFVGLWLLNPKGSFSFICSNSWLDVGYGSDLQEFLLRQCHVRLVIDNEARRSFASADINTVIVLLSAPQPGQMPGLSRTARFVSFRVPFEQVLSSHWFCLIEGAAVRETQQEFRVFPILQSALFADGCEPEVETREDDGRPAVREPSPLYRGALDHGPYTGNKWGGKYLRAPDIYFTLLSKGKAQLRSLSEFFTGERYLNTGGADGFFILTNVEKRGDKCLIVNDCTTADGAESFQGEIEADYLVPLVKDTTKSDKRIQIKEYDAYCLVVRDEPSARLRRYISWGEAQGYDKRSVTRTQRPWYKPTNQMLSAGKILVPRSFGDSFVIFHNVKGFLSLRFYRLHVKQGNEASLAAFLNSTLVAFFIETLGNKSLGQGVLDFFMADFLRMRIPVIDSPQLLAAYKAIKDRPIRRIHDELGFDSGTKRFDPLPDRRAVDDAVFDALKLTKGERDAVYEAVLNMVDARLNKAQSLSVNDTRKRQKAADSLRGIWSGLPNKAMKELLE